MMQAPYLPEAGVPRALYGAAFGILTAVALIYLPGFATTPLGELSPAYLVPVSVTVLAALSVPRRPGRTLHLKASAGVLLGLAPFPSWWTRSESNLFLGLNSSLAIAAAAWHLIEWTLFVQERARERGLDGLANDARGCRIVVLYLLLVPSLGIDVAYLLAQFMQRGGMRPDLDLVWSVVPREFLLLTALPVLNIVRLLVRGATACSRRVPPAPLHSFMVPPAQARYSDEDDNETH